MPARKRTSVKGKRKVVLSESSKAATAATNVTVATWEDDPGDPRLQPPLVPITVAAPN